MATRWLRLIGVLAIVLALLVPSVAAAEPPTDRGNDNLHLRVFVHYPKPDADDAKGGGRPTGPSCTDSSTAAEGYGLTGWHLTGNTVYYVNWATVPSGTEGAIDASFDTWESTSGGKYTFSYQSDPIATTRAKFDGKNIIAWGSVSGSAIGVTYTWYIPSTGEAVEIDTIMNARLKWAWTAASAGDCGGAAGAYDVQDILTHELGHWVGLDDLYTSADKDLTMYGYGVTGELKKDSLATGDISGVKANY